jgi:hypothetical protein
VTIELERIVGLPIDHACVRKHHFFLYAKTTVITRGDLCLLSLFSEVLRTEENDNPVMVSDETNMHEMVRKMAHHESHLNNVRCPPPPR